MSMEVQCPTCGCSTRCAHHPRWFISTSSVSPPLSICKSLDGVVPGCCRKQAATFSSPPSCLSGTADVPPPYSGSGRMLTVFRCVGGVSTGNAGAALSPSDTGCTLSWCRRRAGGGSIIIDTRFGICVVTGGVSRDPVTGGDCTRRRFSGRTRASSPAPAGILLRRWIQALPRGVIPSCIKQECRAVRFVAARRNVDDVFPVNPGYARVSLQ